MLVLDVSLVVFPFLHMHESAEPNGHPNWLFLQLP